MCASPPHIAGLGQLQQLQLVHARLHLGRLRLKRHCFRSRRVHRRRCARSRRRRRSLGALCLHGLLLHACVQLCPAASWRLGAVSSSSSKGPRPTPALPPQPPSSCSSGLTKHSDTIRGWLQWSSSGPDSHRAALLIEGTRSKRIYNVEGMKLFCTNETNLVWKKSRLIAWWLPAQRAHPPSACWLRPPPGSAAAPPPRQPPRPSAPRARAA